MRTFVFAYISLVVTQEVIGGFVFLKSEGEALLLLSLGLMLLSLFEYPVFRIVGLPTEGIGYLFLNFIIILITMYVLTSFIPYFNISETTLPGLELPGLILPAKDLTPVWSLVFSALMFSVFYSFFKWLTPKK